MRFIPVCPNYADIWKRKANKKKWDFNFWILREFASQHARHMCKETKEPFSKEQAILNACLCVNKNEFKMDGHWEYLLASPSSLLFHRNCVVPFCIMITYCFEDAKDQFKQ